jgi:DNA-binding transcriptional MerR regulator
MQPSLSIGDFSRATHLSIKALRYYHRVGLLEPAAVDPATGHRRYAPDQIVSAQVIKRLRSLDMPVDEVGAVIHTTDVARRNDLISVHLGRLEDALARTQEATASLRDLLEAQERPAAEDIEHRRVEATEAAAVHDVVDLEDISSWFQGAFGEIHAVLGAQGLRPVGVSGGIYATELFSHERGDCTVFVPSSGPVRPAGRVEQLVVPDAELAITTHAGNHRNIDQSYGSLAAYVAEHAIAVEGPIREYYVVGRRETSDEARWVTEIGWPIFDVGSGRST